jgi:hypothetical protein
MDERDTTPTEIERFDAINAAGAMTQHARVLRRQARSRKNSGPHLASHRAWLREQAKDMEEGAERVQAAADRARV